MGTVVKKPAVVEEKPVEKVEPDPAGMRGWAMVGGEVVEGTFLAYESGVVTISGARPYAPEAPKRDKFRGTGDRPDGLPLE